MLFMQGMVAAEAARERRRAALASDVERLRAAADAEFARRVEVERALRDAAALFKRELFEKNEEVASLQVCVHRCCQALLHAAFHDFAFRVLCRLCRWVG